MMSVLFGDPAQLIQLQFRNFPDAFNTVCNLLGIDEKKYISLWSSGESTVLAILENMVTVCNSRQNLASAPGAVRVWETHILSILFAIEWLYGLEDTYELHP
jgi:hypothetical protein